MAGNTPEDRTEILARLAEELAGIIEAGETVNIDQIMTRFSVTREEVNLCLAPLRIFDEALGEDLPEAIAPPKLPEDYEILREIGSGGMGIVYRARQKSLDRDVAVKVLRPGELIFGEMIKRFEKEARTLAKLRHPNIVSIYEVGKVEGTLFFSMDLIEGQPLDVLIREGAIPFTRTVRLLRQVADAIAYTHGHGLIHRDLKPGNILVDTKDDAFVVDFGLARDAAVKSDLTASGHLLGTPAYMSPEQARGELDKIGEATDIYALGAILYECLTGQRPFQNNVLVDLIQDVIHEDPRPPRKLRPQIPRDLETICLKAMEKKPDRRYPTMQAFLDDLQRFQEGRPILAKKRSPLQKVARLAKKQRSPLLTGLAVAVVFGLVSWLFRSVDSPEVSLEKSGDELHSSDEHASAAIVYEQALGKLEKRGLGRIKREGVYYTENLDRDIPEEKIRSIQLKMLRCRLKTIRLLIRKGKTSDALEMAQSTLARIDLTESLGDSSTQSSFLHKNDSIEKSKSELKWESARCHALLGENLKAGKLCREFAYEKMSRLDFDRRWGWLHETLDHLVPEMLDPKSAYHAISALYAATILSKFPISRDAVSWVHGQYRNNPLIFTVLLQQWEKMRKPSGLRVRRLPKGPELREVFEDWKLLSLMREFVHYSRSTEGTRVEQDLLRRAQDNQISAAGRILALDLLCFARDFPFDPIQAHWENEDPASILSRIQKPVVDLWNQCRGLSREKELLARLGAAIRTPEYSDSDWCPKRTGLPDTFFKGSPESVLTRLTKLKNGDLPASLARNLKIPQAPTEKDAGKLLQRMMRASQREQVKFHYLLRLISPAVDWVPSRRIEESDSDIVMLWKNDWKSATTSYVLRVAEFDLSKLEGPPIFQWEDVHEISLGGMGATGVFAVSAGPAKPDIHTGSFEVSPPGLLPPQAPIKKTIPGYHNLSYSHLSGWYQDRAFTIIHNPSVLLEGVHKLIPPYQSSGGKVMNIEEEPPLGGLSVLEGTVTILGHHISGGTWKAWVATLHPATEKHAPWGYQEWKVAIHASAKEVIQINENNKRGIHGDFKSDHLRKSAWKRNLLLGNYFPMPRFMADFILSDEQNKGSFPGLFGALLMAGNPDILEHPKFQDGLEEGKVWASGNRVTFTPEEGLWLTGNQGYFWARLLLVTKDPAIRKFCLDKLEQFRIHPSVAKVLLHAEKNGKIQLSEKLRSQMAPKWVKDPPLQLVPVILPVLVGLGSLLFLFRSRLWPGFGLWFSGMVLLSFHYETEWLTRAAFLSGLSFTALGSFFLARASGGIFRWAPAIAFLLALVFHLMQKITHLPRNAVELSIFMIALGISATPILAAKVAPSSSRIWAAGTFMFVILFYGTPLLYWRFIETEKSFELFGVDFSFSPVLFVWMALGTTLLHLFLCVAKRHAQDSRAGKKSGGGRMTPTAPAGSP